MYTHLYFTKEDAERLFKAFAPKPEQPGRAVTRGTLDAHFAEFSQTYLEALGATMERVPAEGLYVLKFREYLPALPEALVSTGVKVVLAEIVRFNSAPTRACAGYYLSDRPNFSATVERVFPPQTSTHLKPAPLYSQNITVRAPSLVEVQQCNTKLSQGHLSRFLVNAFE